jgi:hypothetical protein
MGDEIAAASLAPAGGRTMSIATMLADYKADRATAKTIEKRDFHGWSYTYLDTSRGVRVAVTDPRGKFEGYYPLPRKRALQFA